MPSKTRTYAIFQNQGLNLTYFILKFTFLTLFAAQPFTSNAQFNKGSQVEFGKNRVQYNDWFWNFYRYREFDVYFYGEKELSIFAAKTAIKEKDEIEKSLDFRMDGRIQFFIFNKLSDLKQSNIGLNSDGGEYNTGGVTPIVGRKVLLYFDGNHENFKRQIRKGIAQIELNELLFGGDIKDLFQNAAMLNLPDWYVQGLTSFFSESWNVDIDNKVKDGILTKKYKKFARLTGSDATYAGHSVWKYIYDTYGEAAVANIIYMTRINRNSESGFNFVLGTNLKNLNTAWFDHYKKKYSTADSARTLPTEKPIRRTRAKFVYSQLKISPDARKVAYTTNELGKYRVYIEDLEKSKRKKIKKGGYKTIVQENDHTFPLLAWHPGGQILSMIREHKGKIVLGNYNLETKKYEENPLFNFEKVLDASYSDDGANLVLSAVIKSQSDIYVYNLRTHTFEQITKDFYDDLNPRFTARSKQIVFSSNRVMDSLGVDKADVLPANNNTDIFIYDYKSRSKLLKRVTNTPLVNETNPLPVDSSTILFLGDNNGIINRYTAHLDSTISYIDTTEHYRFVSTNLPSSNYSRNIVAHDINVARKKYAETIFSKGKYFMFLSDLQSRTTPSNIELRKTEFKNTLFKALDDTLKTDSIPDNETPTEPKIIGLDEINQANPQVKDSNSVDINNYEFQSDIPRSKKKKTENAVVYEQQQVITADSSNKEKKEFRIPKLRIYETAFGTNYFVSQLDNSLLNTAYQAYNGGGGYYNPPLNSFFKIGISDLLEDYKITGGIRLSYNLVGNEYFFSYEDLKKRLDKQIIYYQGGRESSLGDYLTRLRTHEIRYLAKWPFSDIAAVRGSASYRIDHVTVLSTDAISLKQPDRNTHWASIKGEYIFDNTINRGLNLLNGTRFKAFAEVFKQPAEEKTWMGVLGLDLRNYLKVHRDIIWANRLAGSTSFGQQKLIYFMGGVDNEFLSGPNFDNSTSIDQSQNYAYQAIATNMRGFTQNIRNGSNFLVVNSELRVPLFKYLFNRPIRSDMIRNFQLVGFGDVGTAWNGKSPYSNQNSVNNNVIANGPITVYLKTQRDPIIAGYGWGMRTRIFGYFIRTDWAWGYADGVFRPRIFYLSMSLDF